MIKTCIKAGHEALRQHVGADQFGADQFGADQFGADQFGAVR